ncbi:glycoside hydrolase family 13 protein [Microbulbifer pacificus]|uniref:Glycoside hydrolase family 13 protein n=1 Tax=Microbulbifer pacificus TaxID=407164 RepID=A0AAU0N3K0_9GAMM|nr:glycoside hydrolase family 13 protein [Microbulbifer pacificus]WOX06859.1 glycoside hydrolase family 13 protein [Microbulbifer pacificus]
MSKPTSRLAASLMFTLTFTLHPAFAEAVPSPQLERAEPPFWWTDMAEPNLQLMLHGRDLAGAEVSLDYPGVTITSTEREQNPNYLFINLAVGEDAKPGTLQIQLRQGDWQQVLGYELKPRAAGSAERKGFDTSDAIYLITPDRFANGDTGNDRTADTLEGPDRGNPGGRHGGDIAGMQQHLDYIASMGFTQVWPNPLLENNQPAYSYHGYSATDYYRIDPRFGSNESFRAFVAAAKNKGIGVIQDMVPNHIGSGHWWLKDLPGNDWLNGRGIQPGDFEYTNHARTVHIDPYASHRDHQLFTDGWFVDSMPDPNQRNSRMANYLIQNAIWWVEYADLSGIRVDTYAYSDADFLTDWSARLMREYPNFNIVGEEWTRQPALVAYWQAGNKNRNGYVSHVPSMMDFPLLYGLRDGLELPESWNTGLVTLYEALANDVLYPNPNNLVILGGNHDMSRLYSQLDEDLGKFRMAVTYIATMRGIPQFYYGDEILATSPKQRDDGTVRSDFPGGWAGDRVNAFNGKNLSGEQQRAQDFVRTLFNWRKDKEVIHRGQLKHFAPIDGLYIYFRYDDRDTVMVAINKSDKPRELPLAHLAEMLGDKRTATDIVGGKPQSLKNLVIAAGDAQVFEIQ